jgi:hypothetical protein
MFTSTHRDRRPGASLNRSRQTLLALWIALIAAVLVPTLADATPVSSSDKTAQAAHAKKQCKKGTHRKATRRHGKRHAHCVKNKAIRRTREVLPVSPQGSPQIPPVGDPQIQPSTTPATRAPQAAVQNVDVYSTGPTPGGIQSRQFKDCVRPFLWNDGRQYSYCNYFTESSLGAGFDDRDWLYLSGSEWIRYQVVRCDATDATNCWYNGPTPSFNGQDPSPY